MSVTTNAKRGKPDPQSDFPLLTAARNILTEGKRILSNTEGTAGHAGTGADITA